MVILGNKLHKKDAIKMLIEEAPKYFKFHCEHFVTMIAIIIKTDGELIFREWVLCLDIASLLQHPQI